MSKILIACKTCWQYQQRRKRCWNTWMAEADKLGQDYILHFAVGSLKEVEGDSTYLFLPIEDRYPPSPLRMAMLCEWALERVDWDYLFCMDDDTRLSVARLLAYDTKGADYIGPEWRPGVGYASGGGNFLSRRAAKIVAKHLTDLHGHDDLRLGRILREHGINLTVDNERFKVLMPLDAKPGPGDNWVYATPRVREQ